MFTTNIGLSENLKICFHTKKLPDAVLKKMRFNFTTSLVTKKKTYLFVSRQIFYFSLY